MISRNSGGKEDTPFERAREALESTGKDLAFFLMLVMVDFAYGCWSMGRQKYLAMGNEEKGLEAMNESSTKAQFVPNSN